MILLPNKEYSQRLLDELNCIGYRFLESATEYLIDEDDEEYLAQELEWFFPEHLVNQDMQRCLDTLKTLCRWMVIIAAEMLRRSRLRCCGVPRCAATR